MEKRGGDGGSGGGKLMWESEMGSKFELEMGRRKEKRAVGSG